MNVNDFNGDGNFTLDDSYAIGGAASVFAGDLDNDEDLDLVAANWADGIISVLMNNGDGTFVTHVPYTVSTIGAFGVIVADYNRDSFLDISVSIHYDLEVYVLLNNGDGTFSQDSTYRVEIGPYYNFAADLDGDNYLDLIVANYHSDTLSVLMNNEDDTFAPQLRLATGNGPLSIIAADFNGDGDLDLANSNNIDSTVSVFFKIPPKNPIFTKITDVPNDQEKQVRVSWFKTRFDGVASDSTVVDYSLWRRIDDLLGYLAGRVNQELFDLKNNSSANFDTNHFNNIFSPLSDQLPPT